MGTPEGTIISYGYRSDQIINHIGGSFGYGAAFGSFLHYLVGFYNSPQGYRMIGGAQAVRMYAPGIGGRCAAWGGLFSTFSCTMVYLRQKEDPWNSIMSGAATGGVVSMRKGVKAATRSGVFGGVALALIEGGLWLKSLWLGNRRRGVFVEGQLPQAVEGTSSWFGGKKMKEKKKGVKSEILESAD